ncbi:hypothetical protein BDW62DRAFT_207823 [Aspergillus aurantiobrunneus]
MAPRIRIAILLSFAILPLAIYLGRDRLSTSCRCFPDDTCWPLPEQWDNLNASLSGNLIATIPIGSVCHTNTSFAPYSRQKCSELQSHWSIPATHYQDPSSPMAACWANFSCSPFTAGCTLKVLHFTTRHNIRLSIRNTGHDYLGKSTAPGSVALWTHNLKSIEYKPNYTTSWYAGPALRVGAGIQGLEAQDVAHRSGKGHVIVSGHSPDIGFAGGYTQGGGHGPLASRYGLAADQVLEWEVVTAKGGILTAFPGQNADLYWALAGGGGGTFAVVVRMTVRMYPEEQTASASLAFQFDAADSQAWEVVRTFLLGTPPLTDAGGTALWVLYPGPTAATFIGGPIVLPGAGAEELQSYLAPTLELLREYEMGYTTTAVNVTEFHVGGALVPRSTIQSNPNGFISTLQEILRHEAAISSYSMNVSRPTNSPVSANAVNPAWRNAAVSLLLGIPFNYTDHQVNVENQKLMTDVLLPQVSALVGPGKQGALLKIKQKYDPKQIFYGRTAVGSERWVEHGNGRLCYA